MPRRVFVTRHPEGSIIDAWVVPGAIRNDIVGIHDGAVRVRVTAPPERGRANKATTKLLRDALGARDVYLERGARSRRKRFVVRGLSPQVVEERLGL